MKLKLQFIIAIFIALVIYIPAVQAQANPIFSGGNGKPLSITLTSPITYTISETTCQTSPGFTGTGPLFLFDEAGNPFGGGTLRNFTGNITYSINGGAPQLITIGNSGTSNNSRTTNDIFVAGIVQSLPLGSTVVLSAGTITTTTDVAAPPPTSGSFTTFIVSNTSVRCSTNGVSVAPTAATVSVSGRVMTMSGRGIMNVRLSLTDSNGEVRTATTTAFGYYHFDNVQAGETYILSAVGKRYTFSPPVQVLNINEETDAVNFIANSIKY
jgi:hypothetical protein